MKSSKSRRSRGSLFHSVDAATENVLSPKVRIVFWDANASKMLADDERKLLEPSKMLADDERKLLEPSKMLADHERKL